MRDFNLKKRLGCFGSPWDRERLSYMIRQPTYQEAQQIPAEYDGLAEYLPCQGDQGNIGSCCGWAGKGLTHAIVLLNEKRNIDVSAGSIYLHSREYTYVPVNQEGSTPLGVMKLLTKVGATTEECAPTDTESPFELNECINWKEIAADFRVFQYHQVPTDPESIKAALYGITYIQPYTMPDGSPGKCPLYLAIKVYKSFKEANTNGGVVPMPSPGETLLGGHAILIRGWKNIDGQDYWILVNSWGTDIGDKGIYYLPVGYTIDEAWMITDDEPHPGPEPAPRDKKLTPMPSSCPVGNGAARLLNIPLKFAKRTGRFYYLNPR